MSYEHIHNHTGYHIHFGTHMLVSVPYTLWYSNAVSLSLSFSDMHTHTLHISPVIKIITVVKEKPNYLNFYSQEKYDFTITAF